MTPYVRSLRWLVGWSVGGLVGWLDGWYVGLLSTGWLVGLSIISYNSMLLREH